MLKKLAFILSYLLFFGFKIVPIVEAATSVSVNPSQLSIQDKIITVTAQGLTADTEYSFKVLRRGDVDRGFVQSQAFIPVKVKISPGTNPPSLTRQICWQQGAQRYVMLGNDQGITMDQCSYLPEGSYTIELWKSEDIGSSRGYQSLAGFTVITGVTITLSTNNLDINSTSGIQASFSGLRPDLTDKYKYYIARNKGEWTEINAGSGISLSPDGSGNLSLYICPRLDIYTYHQTAVCNQSFQNGTYKIKITLDGTDLAISSAFMVSSVTTTSIQCTNTSFTTSDHIGIEVSGLTQNILYKVSVNNQNPRSGDGCQSSFTNGVFNYDLGAYDEGTYQVRVMKGSDPNICSTGDVVAQAWFTISNDLDNPGSCATSPPDTIIEPEPPPGLGITECKKPGDAGYDPNSPDACSTAAGKECQDGRGINTAIGCIPTNPQALVRGLLRFSAGIGGGFALLLMVIGAFEMITSTGNPDRLKSGQERFRDAIIGLLFVIFSTLLMKILGIDILGLDKFLGI